MLMSLNHLLKRPSSTPFSLYRPGSELRGVLYPSSGRKRVMDACRYWKERGQNQLKVTSKEGQEARRELDWEGPQEWDEIEDMVGCDEPILLGEQ